MTRFQAKHKLTRMNLCQPRMLSEVVLSQLHHLAWGGRRGGGRRGSWTEPPETSTGSSWYRGNAVWLHTHHPCLCQSSLLMSSISQACPVRHLSLNRGCHSGLVRLESCDTLSMSLQSKDEITNDPADSPPEATIWPKSPESEPLSARLHWKALWVRPTSMSLFCSPALTFMSRGFPSLLDMRVLWPPWAYRRAHTWLSDNPGSHCPQLGSEPALQAP